MNFQRYLSAKRTVDDRALNRRVEERLAEEIEGRDRLRVLEVGAGIGATVARLLARPWLPDRVFYTALELRPENVAAARKRLPARAVAMGYTVRTTGDPTRTTGERLVCSRGSRRIEIDFRTVDAFEFLAETDEHWDLLVAHAFVDLVDPADALATFRDALAPEGVAYCPITFDGGTFFEPVTDREFERHLVERFHRHLDQSGDSEAGRHLLALASGREVVAGREREQVEGSRTGDRNEDTDERGAVLAAGGSDWLVHPRDGEYPADEAYFLHRIVDLIAGAVREDPEVENHRLLEWTGRRHDQIDEASLVYCAHQLDLLFR